MRVNISYTYQSYPSQEATKFSQRQALHKSMAFWLILLYMSALMGIGTWVLNLTGRDPMTGSYLLCISAIWGGVDIYRIVIRYYDLRVEAALREYLRTAGASEYRFAAQTQQPISPLVNLLVKAWVCYCGWRGGSGIFSLLTLTGAMLPGFLRYLFCAGLMLALFLGHQRSRNKKGATGTWVAIAAACWLVPSLILILLLGGL